MKESINKTFNQFKIHSQYSICEGAVKIDQLKDFCKKNKIKSLGLSDTYNLSGALEFAENLSSVGTQPIIGTQILFKYKELKGLIPLIAKNHNGYKNIIKLSSKSYLEINPSSTKNFLVNGVGSYTSHIFPVAHAASAFIVIPSVLPAQVASASQGTATGG